MFKLLLMRHGKSDWQYDLPDIRRPLNKRGQRDAHCIGSYLLQQNIIPDRLVLSPSQRTRDTAEQLLTRLPLSPEAITIDNDLYLADRETLLEAAELYAANNRVLLLLAHNPGMDEAVSYLSEHSPGLSSKGKLMTTCAIACFEIKNLQALHQAGRCHLRQLVRPEDICRG